MKTIVLTGGTGDIGKCIASSLCTQPVHLILIGKTAEELTSLKDELIQFNCEISTYEADLSCLEQTKRCVVSIKNDFSQIDVLINHAGVYNYEKQTTDEGFEVTLVTNYLSVYLITLKLLPELEKAAKINGHAQILLPGSEGHRKPINWEDLNFSTGEFDGPFAYQHSKHLVISFAFSLARQLEGSNIQCYAVHPGAVNTGLLRGKKLPFPLNILFPIMGATMTISPEKAAETYHWLIFSGESKHLHGKLVYNKKEMKVWKPVMDISAQNRLRGITDKMISNWLS